MKRPSLKISYPALAAACAVAGLVAISSTAVANSDWVNPSGGNFATPSNWSAGVPDSTDQATFSLGVAQTYLVTLGQPLNPIPIHPTVESLWIGPNTVTLLGLNGSTLAIDDLDNISQQSGLVVGMSNDPGNGPPAVLNDNLAALTTTSATIGYTGDGTMTVNGGTFTVAGPVGTFSNGLRIGYFGHGFLRVRNGADAIVGTVTNPTNGYVQINGNGGMELTDPGTTLNTRGLSLDGTMTISNGATATTNGGNVSMGFLGSSDSALTVTGSGSSFSGGDMQMGGNGSGSLSITSSGIVNCGNVTMRDATALVSNLGSHWTMSGDLTVGASAQGGISILNGSDVRNVNAHLGTATETIHGSFSIATVTLNGTGATWRNTGTVFVGDGIAVASVDASLGSLIYSVGAYLGNYYDAGIQYRATGTVNLNGNGTAWTNTGAFYVGYRSNGRVNIAGGAKLVSDSVFVGAFSGSNGSIDISGTNSKLQCGSLNIGFGTAAMTALVSVRSGGVIQGLVNVGSFGQLSGDGTIIGNVSNAGLVSPGSSPATLNVSGNFSQSSTGKMRIELASASSYDRIAASGSAAFNGGSMGVAALDSYIPLPGASFAVMTYSSRSGNTLNVLNETGYAGLRFTPTFGTNTLTLLVGALFPGDANLDGRVDVTDLGILATNWQTTAVWTGGDFSFDGFVDVTDLGLLATNWQAGTSSARATAAVGLGGDSVPEPVAGGLVAAIVLCIRNRRR